MNTGVLCPLTILIRAKKYENLQIAGPTPNCNQELGVFNIL